MNTSDRKRSNNGLRLDIKRSTAEQSVTQNTQRIQEWATKVLRSVNLQKSLDRRRRFMLMGG